MPPRDTYDTAEDLATVTITDADQVATNTTVTTAEALEFLTDAITTVGTTRIEPITLEWNDAWNTTWHDTVGRRKNTENEIELLKREVSEIKEKFDVILNRLDEVLGKKLVISDLDLARLLGLGEV